jgi:hypothetical protein
MTMSEGVPGSRQGGMGKAPLPLPLFEEEKEKIQSSKNYLTQLDPLSLSWELGIGGETPSVLPKELSVDLPLSIRNSQLPILFSISFLLL